MSPSAEMTAAAQTIGRAPLLMHTQLLWRTAFGPVQSLCKLSPLEPELKHRNIWARVMRQLVEQSASRPKITEHNYDLNPDGSSSITAGGGSGVGGLCVVM